MRVFEDIGLDESDLKQISTAKLNTIMKKKKIDADRQKEIKEWRRKIKNRFPIDIDP